MRRKDREIPESEAIELLEQGEYGVLSTVSAEGEPYGVPLSYFYREGAIYVHCALEGQKLANIATNPKVSFCVVGRTELLPEHFTTNYESVIAFGPAAVIDGEERHAALLGLIEKYSPDRQEAGNDYIARLDAVTCVIKIRLTRLTGKARR